MTNLISRTGRVESWLENPTSRLPVSCTVFVVEDSMEGENGIEASWRFVSHALRNGAGCAVHLSKLRARGTETVKGNDKLVASGPVSFGKIYSTLNEILRRGGTYRNGAVVLHLDIDHPDILEFIQTPRQDLPWVKRCVNISPERYLNAPREVIEALLHGIQSGDIWLNKIKYNNKLERIYGNVCLEVYLPSRGTCLLQHINLGACEYISIQNAFVEGMSQLCELHARTGIGDSGEYLPSETDRQVGLGMLGLANLLARYELTYEQFADALEDHLEGKVKMTPAHELVVQLDKGIKAAATVARNYDMVRAFAIAPTASCSYRSKDLLGNTCTPEIAPPISRTVDRDSGTFGVEQFSYGDVETALDVGWKTYTRVANGIMRLLDSTGLLHGYSFNSWSDVVTYDRSFLEGWMSSSQTSLYYSLRVMGDVQDKTDAYAMLDQTEVDSYLDDILNQVTCDCQE